MLAEILLCGLASVNIGMKNASSNMTRVDTGSKASFFNDALSNSMQSYDDFIVPENSGGYPQLEDGAFVIDNMWVNYLQVEEEYNDSVVHADVISPFFGFGTNFSENISNDYLKEATSSNRKNNDFWPKDKSYPKATQYVDYDGFYNKVEGMCLRVEDDDEYFEDKDFFRFYLYGEATVSIKSDISSPVNLYLSDFNSEKLDTGEKWYLDNGEIYVNLNAGTYYICVYSDDKDSLYNYTFDITAEYFISDDTVIEIGYEEYGPKTQGVAWISDFNPLNSKPFYGVNKTTPEKKSLYLTTSLEGGYLNQKILQSSLYIWGEELKDCYKSFLESEEMNGGIRFLEEHKNELVKIKEERDKQKNLEYRTKLVIYAASGYFNIDLSGWEENAAKMEGRNPWEGFSFVDRNFDPLIGRQEETIVKAEEFLKHINNLKWLFDQDIKGKIIKIDSYYNLHWSGDNKNGYLELRYLNELDATVQFYENNEESNFLYSSKHSEKAYMKGSFYRIKNGTDFKDAENHVAHNYKPEEVTIDDCIVIDSGSGGTLPIGKSEWYSYTAEDSGTYSFKTYDNRYRNPDWNLVGELFDRPITGRDEYLDKRDPFEEGFIVKDESSGDKGYFTIHYYLEAGETVFLRVHEKTWHKKVDNYCLFVSLVDDKTIPYDDSYYLIPSITFEHDETHWSYLKFNNPGYKVIQSFTLDVTACIELYDYRGVSIAKNECKDNASSKTCVITAYVNNSDVYLLRIRSPKSHNEYKNGDKGKVYITSTNELCANYESIPVLKNGERTSDDFIAYDNVLEYEINKGESAFAYFTPEVPAFYVFYTYNVAYYTIDLNVYDLNTGEAINSDSDNRRFLDSNHTYFVIANFTNYEKGHGTIKMGVHFYESYFVRPPRYIENISSDEHYVEKIVYKVDELQNLANTHRANDYFFSFEETGYKIFHLEGDVPGNVTLKLYNERSQLLKSDDGKNGLGNNAFISYKVEANKIYRIRVEATLSWARYSDYLKLIIIDTKNENFNSLTDISSLSSPGYYKNISSPGVFKFIAPYDGYVSFELIEKEISQNNGYLYVVDCNYSLDEIIYGTDYVIDEPGGYNSSVLLKRLYKGQAYYVVLPDGDNYDLRIEDYGIDFANATAYENNPNNRNLVTIDGMDKNITIDGTYRPYRNSYVVFDTLSNHNLNRCNIDLEITDFNGNSLPLTENFVFEGKTRKVAFLENGKIYKVKINIKRIDTYVGEQVFNLDIKYADDRHSGNYVYISEGERYYEKVYNLNRNETSDLYLYFYTDGLKLIQTFGNLDTVMELYDSTGELLFEDDNSGFENNAYIAINVTAHEIYKLVLHEKNPSNGGKTKLTITPASMGSFDSYGYQSFDYMSTGEQLSYSTDFYNVSYTCRAFVFEPMVGGKYTFTTTSHGSYEADTYLCVIDVTSADYITDANQNDDSTESSLAKLSMNLVKGHKYFVVCSMCDLYDCYSDMISIKISFVPQEITIKPHKPGIGGGWRDGWRNILN